MLFCRNKHDILQLFFLSQCFKVIVLGSYTIITLLVSIITPGSVLPFVTWSAQNLVLGVLKELFFTLKCPSCFSWNIYSSFRHLSMVTKFQFFLSPFGTGHAGRPDLYTGHGTRKAAPWPISSSEFSCIKWFSY